MLIVWNDFWTGVLSGHLARDWDLPLRAVVAFLVALVIIRIGGKKTAGWLGRLCPEPIRTSSPRLNQLLAAKQATPTMGGLLILAAFLAAVGLTGRASAELWLMIAVSSAFAALGICDDWVKLTTSRKGMSARTKLGIQIALAVTFSMFWYGHVDETDRIRALPWYGNVELGIWLIPFWTLLIVGFSNAVNLTDGLDGLATGSAACSTAAILCLCVVHGDRSELAITAAALLGSLIGFLRFNRHPAQMFMGNTGSLPLGALLAVFAIVLKREELLLPIGAIFVAETLSVILQVGVFQWRRRRILLCAPLHHHFQFLGWAEKTIVRRFWWTAATCCVVSVLLEIATTNPAARGKTNSVRIAQEINTFDELR